MVIYITLAVAILAGLYAFRYLRAAAGRRTARILYRTMGAAALAYAAFETLRDPSLYAFMRAVAVAIIFYACFTLPLCLGAFVQDCCNLVRRLRRAKPSAHTLRGVFIASLVLAGAGVAALVEGMVWGKTDFRTEHFSLQSERVPAGFQGFRIAQISDLHLGSFSPDSPAIPRALNRVQQLHADMIVLTGDILNDNSADMLPFLEHLAALEAPYGKYAVIGNHDYCEYDRSLSPEGRAEQMDSLLAYYRRAGFKVLDNESVPIIRNADTLYLAGVENWGTGPFPARGDIRAALEKVPQEAFTILLSHDPTHFEKVVSRYPKFVDLTLSGHTHAMQFGIRLGRNLQWSPIRYRYRFWAGAYRENGRYLYVNRGLGYHFFPARVGMRPEITVITLEKQTPGSR